MKKKRREGGREGEREGERERGEKGKGWRKHKKGERKEQVGEFIGDITFFRHSTVHMFLQDNPGS